jgi:N6-adenosine-specific RNA methylase IME4
MTSPMDARMHAGGRGAYRVIYADPPWSWAAWSKKGEGRSALNHYSTLSLPEIKALPVADLAAEDSVLLLWAINSMLPQALEVMHAWSFTFKTVAFTWAKQTSTGRTWHMGCGYWTRQNTEQVLLGTRGKPKRLARDVRQLLVAPVREHSRKPDGIRSDIEALLPGPYVECFARESFPGWDVAYSDEPERFRRAA